MKWGLVVSVVFVMLLGVFYIHGSKDAGAAGNLSANPPAMSDSGTGKMMPGRQGMMQHRTEMLRKAGVPEETIHQWQIFMKTQFYMDSPDALLAQGADLGLSQDQKQKLMDIEKDARTKATNVLTAEQKTSIQKYAGTPISFAQLHKTIMSKMKAAHQSMDSGMGRMNCPCPMMEDGGTTTQPTGR